MQQVGQGIQGKISKPTAAGVVPRQRPRTPCSLTTSRMTTTGPRCLFSFDCSRTWNAIRDAPGLLVVSSCLHWPAQVLQQTQCALFRQHPRPGQRLTFTSSVGLQMTAASPPLVLPATTFFKKLGCVSAPIRRFTGSYRPSRAPAAGSRTSAPLCALGGALLPCCAAGLCSVSSPP